jgi:hypothetical protein
VKIVRATAFTLLAAFVVTCAYLARQSDSGKVQREIDKSPMVAPNAAYHIRGWCPPFCDDREVDKYIAKVNSEQPGKKVAQINESEFKRVMYTNNNQLVKVR